MNTITTDNSPSFQTNPLWKRNQWRVGVKKILPEKATINRWRKEVIEKFDILRKKLEQSHMKQQMANEEINIVRRRLDGLYKESLVAFQTVAEKNSHEAENVSEGLK